MCNMIMTYMRCRQPEHHYRINSDGNSGGSSSSSGGSSHNQSLDDCSSEEKTHFQYTSHNSGILGHFLV